MDNLILKVKKYLCTCQEDLIYSSDLKEHLRQENDHKITKFTQSSKKSPAFEINSIIFDQINSSRNFILKKSEYLSSKILSKSAESGLNLIKLLQVKTKKFPKNSNSQPLQTSSLEKAIRKYFNLPIFKEISKLMNLKENIKNSFKIFQKNHTGSILSISFTEDKKFLISGGEDGVLRIWDRISLNIKKSLPFHKSKINSTDSFSIFAVSASSDKTICLWNLRTFKLKTCFHGHSGHVTLVKHLNKKYLVSASEDYSLKFWNIRQKTLMLQIQVKYYSFKNFYFAPDLQSISIFSYGGSLIKYDFNSKSRKIKKITKNKIKCCALIENFNILIIGAHTGIIEIFDLKLFETIKNLEGHSKAVNFIDISKTSQTFASASNDFCVFLWHVQTFELLNIYKLDELFLNCVKILDSKLYISGSSSKIVLCEEKSNKIVKKTNMKIFYKFCLAISIKYQLLVYGWGEVSLYCLKSNSELNSKKMLDSIECFYFIGSKILCGSSKGTMHLLQTPSLIEIWKKSFTSEFLYFVRGTKDLKTIAYSTFTQFYIVSNPEINVMFTHLSKVIAGQFIESMQKFVFIDLSSNVYILRDYQTLIKVSNFPSTNQIYMSADGENVIGRNNASEFTLVDAERNIQKLRGNKVGDADVKKRYPNKFLVLSSLSYSNRLD